MSKKKLIVLVAIFNVIMIVAFIFSNLYVWDFFNTKITLQGGRQDNGIYVIPFIQIDGFQITIGHSAWASDGVIVPTALPITILNYPFIIFWIAIIGNLILIAFLIQKSKK